jgi:hypothetical protein
MDILEMMLSTENAEADGTIETASGGTGARRILRAQSGQEL